MNDTQRERRRFLRYVLASPFLLSSEAQAVERLLAAVTDPDSVDDPALTGPLITQPGDAVNVFDLRAVAKQRLSPGHYAYLSLGVDHELTLRANRDDFDRVKLRPRRLVDTRDIDTSLTLLDTRLSSPIILAPCGAQKAFHPEAELATARGARKRDHLMILSSGTSTDFTEVDRARRGALWPQLPYPARIEMATDAALEEAQEAGCSAVVLTVDIVGMNENRDRLGHFHRGDNPECQSCHGGAMATLARGLGAIGRSVGVDPRDVISNLLALDWDEVARIRDATELNLVVKGILTHEDARLCVENGVDAIVVSNHGGRAEDSGLSTIAVLPEIVEAVGGRIPILVDSGFRRGTDVFKALALGASAVCIGRPYLWGLSAFGQEGVETALALMQRELVMCMKAMGTPNLSSISAAHVMRAAATG